VLEKVVRTFWPRRAREVGGARYELMAVREQPSRNQSGLLRVAVANRDIHVFGEVLSRAIGDEIARVRWDTKPGTPRRAERSRSPRRSAEVAKLAATQRP
jgi:hypothetical protein